MPSRRLVLSLVAACLLAPAPAAALARAPAGFTVVTSGDFASAASRQTHGTVDCPAGTVPLGGGVVTALFSDQTINSSYPTATGWAGDVNNPDATASIFSLTVACAQRPRGYTVFTTLSTLVPAGQQASTSAICPAGKNALGGGVFSDSGQVSVNLAKSFPVPGQWSVAENNASAVATHMTAYAVCGRARNYHIVSNPLDTLNTGITTGGVQCARPQVATGGGVFTNTTDSRVNIGASFWDQNGWSLYLRSAATGVDVAFQPFAVCVG
jgi:hypothetical protein